MGRRRRGSPSRCPATTRSPMREAPMPAHRVDGPARVTGARRSGRRTRAALRAAQCKRLAPGSRVVVRCAPAITAATSMSFAQPAWRSSLGVSGMCSRRHRRCRCRNAMAARSPFAGALVRRVTADDGEGGGGSWAHRTDSAAGRCGLRSPPSGQHQGGSARAPGAREPGLPPVSSSWRSWGTLGGSTGASTPSGRPWMDQSPRKRREDDVVLYCTLSQSLPCSRSSERVRG